MAKIRRRSGVRPQDERRATVLGMRVDTAITVALVVISAAVNAIFIFATKNAQTDQVQQAVKKLEDETLPAIKRELKEYVKDRDDMRADQMRQLNETLREQGRLLSEISRDRPRTMMR